MRREQGAVPGHGSGRCDLVTVPARQGLEAVDILRRRGGQRAAGGGEGGEGGGGAGAAGRIGPVLHDGGCDTIGFLVPAGTAERWDLPGSACVRAPGAGTRQAAAAGAPPVDGTGWLLPPDSVAEVTDPAVLRAALGEAGRLIEAVDRCR
ncbi:hypothetical protein HCK00_18575 [Streptomyces sp. PLAI1-29]|uniref:Uncharacterized protein n=1 Tax=Streptomyces zingiberis TaxID=2053010 RepID=A0ABX1BXS2_9ACTN|nr:hypothetical protein [Streptomyces zingiberis]NJQ02491.1 hypothetical protein [Streptomyces zingiberis]